MFQKFDWDGTSYINTLGLQDMTPGFVDAGTLGGESVGTVLADDIFWLQSTATGPSTGQMSTSQVAPVGRFSLPSSMLANVADAPAGDESQPRTSAVESGLDPLATSENGDELFIGAVPVEYAIVVDDLGHVFESAEGSRTFW